MRFYSKDEVLTTIEFKHRERAQLDDVYDLYWRLMDAGKRTTGLYLEKDEAKR